MNNIDFYQKKADHVSLGHWICFFNTILVLILALPYVIVDLPIEIGAFIFFIFYWLGHFTILSFGFYLIFLFPLSFLFKKTKSFLLFYSFISALGLSFLVIDLFLYLKFKLHLGYFSFELFINQINEIIPFFSIIFLLLFITFFALENFLGNFLKNRKTKAKNRKNARIIFLFLIVFFIISHIIYMFADALNYQPISKLKNSFPLSYPTTAKQFLKTHGMINVIDNQESPEEKTQKKIEKYNSLPHLKLDQSSLKNILLINISAWRFDMQDQNVVPNIAKFKKKSLTFKNHLATNKESKKSIYSMFYSLPATYKKYNLKSKYLTALEHNNFQFQAFSQDDDFYLDKDLWSIAKKSTTDKANTDRQNINSLINYLKKPHKKPFFVYLNLTSAKNFTRSKSSKTKFTPDLKDYSYLDNQNKNETKKLKNTYKNSLHYIDLLLKEVFVYLEKSNLLESTKVILTADHGMDLNDNSRGNIGYNSSYSPYQIKVPFIFYNQGETGLIDRLSTHFDIGAFLLDDMLEKKVIWESFSFAKSKEKLATRRSLSLGDKENLAIYKQDYLTEFNYKKSSQSYDMQYNPIDKKTRTKNVVDAFNSLDNFYFLDN